MKPVVALDLDRFPDPGGCVYRDRSLNLCSSVDLVQMSHFCY